MLSQIRFCALAAVSAIALGAASGANAADCPVGPALCDTDAAPMMIPFKPWTIDPIFTVGENIKGYTPVGIPDGIGAFKTAPTTVRVLVNHELSKGSGAPYTLANGTTLTGGRVSYFDIATVARKIRGAGPAYSSAYDRQGNLVTTAQQINETTSATDGFDRFCSSQGYAAGDYGFVDNIYFTHEETSEREGHPFGGSVWAIDVDDQSIWAAPALGRAAWENVTALTPQRPNTVALALGDDYGGLSKLPGGSVEYKSAPLWIYVGKKKAGGFLERNGLSDGQLYFYKAAASCADTPTFTSPVDFHGTGSVMTGVLCPIEVQDVSMAGQPGYDAYGYLNGETLRATAFVQGAFAFSRPEDLQVNPLNGRQFVFASTGRSSNFPEDSWGDTLVVTVGLNSLTASVRIAYDGDDVVNNIQFANPDDGLRSPDNLTWARDGFVYVNEDPAFSGFGLASGAEASIWQVNPKTSKLFRVAEMDRSAVPAGQTDTAPNSIGVWESSGVRDVSRLFDVPNNVTLLISDVQAHSLTGGRITSDNLVQGGQIFFLRRLRPNAAR